MLPSIIQPYSARTTNAGARTRTTCLSPYLKGSESARYAVQISFRPKKPFDPQKDNEECLLLLTLNIGLRLSLKEENESFCVLIVSPASHDGRVQGDPSVHTRIAGTCHPGSPLFLPILPAGEVAGGGGLPAPGRSSRPWSSFYSHPELRLRSQAAYRQSLALRFVNCSTAASRAFVFSSVKGDSKNAYLIELLPGCLLICGRCLGHSQVRDKHPRAFKNEGLISVWEDEMSQRQTEVMVGTIL